MQLLLGVSQGLHRIVAAFGALFSWLFIATMAVIVFDVVTRKFGFQIPGFGSTKLQEMEWHLHVAVFAPWLGLCYLHNAHVRIDVFTGNLPARTQAWIELVGCLVFAIPYCLVVFYFSGDFALLSFMQNESSDAPTGLPYRWIIKFVLFLGIVALLAAVISVFLRKLVYLFGPPELRELAADRRPGGH
jgi:TRAP-type mannitol/chloroaromatic compound transport system permease small subunit